MAALQFAAHWGVAFWPVASTASNVPQGRSIVLRYLALCPAKAAFVPGGLCQDVYPAVAVAPADVAGIVIPIRKQ